MDLSVFFFLLQIWLPVQSQQPSYIQQHPAQTWQQDGDLYGEPLREQNIYDQTLNSQPVQQIYSTPTYGGNLKPVKPDYSFVQDDSNIIYEPVQTASSEPYHLPRLEQTEGVFDPVRRIENTTVDCRKNRMIVTFEFSAPFSGFIYPHLLFPACILFGGSNSYKAVLTLYHGPCGRRIIENQNVAEFTATVEHRLMIQWEREFICEDDSSVIVRCDKPDDFNKTISWDFGTFDLASTLEISKHPGPKMWMEILRGQESNSPLLDDQPVSIGEVLTLIFTLSDDVFLFDANILQCNAFPGIDNQIEWSGESSPAASGYSTQMTTVEDGCSVRLKIFSNFKKERITKDGNLITLLYAHFKAFRFPTSSKVVLKCDVQACYKNCRDSQSCSNTGFQPRAAKLERKRRSLPKVEQSETTRQLERVGLSKSVEIVTPEDGVIKKIFTESPLSFDQLIDALIYVMPEKGTMYQRLSARDEIGQFAKIDDEKLFDQIAYLLCPFKPSTFYGLTTFFIAVIIVFGIILFVLKTKLDKVPKKASFFTPPPKNRD